MNRKIKDAIDKGVSEVKREVKKVQKGNERQF